ncbi:hypothetical protein FRC08_001673 [Ceratobasidium sp. 394]|nr:hypothetical protein FRC08_001673 [Ceratobasidium sp. 394]KAG9092099.1 hypothetical protein FS749_016006 [Ceratobasidium sp. UAMH 11750]
MPRIAGLLRRSLGRVRPYVPSFARSQGLRFPCPYCGHLLKTESGRSKHIAKSPTCSRAEQSATTRTDAALAITTEEAEVEADLETDREAEVESFADTSTTSGWQAPNSGSSSTSSRRSEAGEVPRALTECEGSHTTTNEPYQPPDSANGEEPMRWDEKEGGFVERFPDLRAGAPINNRVARVPDMDVYLAAAGNLADPFHFATAELLMTTGLTGMARDEHLKSHMVSNSIKNCYTAHKLTKSIQYVGRTPWASNAALMADIDRLPHGPEWKIYEMDVSVPGNPNQQSYLFTRNIVEVICDIMAESSFCGDMEYTPKRVWQDETCTTRIYGNSWSGDWWWRMQVSEYTQLG